MAQAGLRSLSSNADGPPRPRIRLEVRDSRDDITAIPAAEAWSPLGFEWTELRLAAVGPASPCPRNRAWPDQVPGPIRAQAWGWSSLARPRVSPGVRSSTCDDADRRPPSSFPCDRPQVQSPQGCQVRVPVKLQTGRLRMTTLRMTSWAPRRLRFAGFAAWRFLEPFYESSDLPGHTPTPPFGRHSPG